MGSAPLRQHSCVRKVDPGITGSLPAACFWVRQIQVSPVRLFPLFPLQALVLDKGVKSRQLISWAMAD